MELFCYGGSCCSCWKDGWKKVMEEVQPSHIYQMDGNLPEVVQCTDERLNKVNGLL